ncbi:hypothetical protein AB0H86_11895 [Streptomyces sp. NPDC050997]|uniref:hypothetical protein n=1 Tax=Streptomyces sp. NPDC050997 TaxID=3155519 RepID=UPI003432A41D
MADTQTFTTRNRHSHYRDKPFVPAPATRFAGAELKAAPAHCQAHRRVPSGICPGRR